MSLIAVTGATGQLGRLVIERLVAAGQSANVVALVRDTAKAAASLGGVAARPFDYNKPETLAPSLAGVGVLLLISGSEVGQRVAQHTSVVEAAKKAGVQQIIYTSLLKADASTSLVAPEHVATEAAVKASGLKYTVLRNGWYTENYVSAASIGGALQFGAVLGSAKEGRISGATREDYADAAVAVLLKPEAHVGATYELAGDASFTLAQLATEVAKQSGKPVVYKNLPEAEYTAALKGFGVPEEWANVIPLLDTAAAKDDYLSEDRALSALIGRPTTPLSASVAAVLKAL